MKKIKKRVKIRLITDLLGTVPTSKEIYADFIESKRPQSVEGPPETTSVKEREERGWTGFHVDEKGLFMYDYAIKGFFKNAGNVLKDDLKIKNLRSKITNLLFVQPRKIYFKKKKPDGVVERPLQAQTMQGPRVTLVRSDSIAENTTLEFDVVLLKGKDELKEEIISQLLEYGELLGLGQFRTGGYGRFEVVSIK